MVRVFSSLRQSDRVYLGWFVWDFVKKLLKMQASRRPEQTHKTSVLLHLLLALCLNSISQSAGIHMWSPGCTMQLVFFWVFLPFSSMLILSLLLLGLSSKSTSLSPDFCVCTPRQYNTISWQLNLISEFFAYFG